MERTRFVDLATTALEHIEARLGGLEHENLDVELGGDVLKLSFTGGAQFVINAHSAAEQIWMAANRSAWHFDYDPARDAWIAGKTGDELMGTVARVVGEKLGISVTL